jgi:hypothetical protein
MDKNTIETTQTTTAILGEDLNFSPTWRESLPEDLRADRSLEGIRDLRGLASGYVNAQKLIGQKTINAIPGDDATPEQRQSFMRALGVPEKPEDYGLKKPEKLPEGMAYNDELQKEFAGKAHELGFTAKQAQGLLEWFNGKGVGEFETMQQRMGERRTQAETELKKEWGKAYDGNLELANRVIRDLGVAEILKAEGLDNSPELAKMFVAIAKRTGEDTNIKAAGSGNMLMSPGDAKQKISGMQNDRNNPYWQADHPNHQAAVDEMARLFQMAYPSQG